MSGLAWVGARWCVGRQKYVVQHIFFFIFFVPRDEFGTIFVRIYIADTTI